MIDYYSEENKSAGQNSTKASRRGPSDLQRSLSESHAKKSGTEDMKVPSTSQSQSNDEDEDREQSILQTRSSQQLVGCDSFQTLSFETSMSSTPPLTPGRSPNKSADTSLIANASLNMESPYDPLLTPAFRYSSPRHPIDQPWRFPSPSHPLHSKAHDLSLCMLMRGEASPIVSGLDVSPVVIMPASERTKRSIFSSPLVNLAFQDKDSPLKLEGSSKLRGMASPSPRRLFGEGGPVPITDRAQFKKYRIPQSPLGKSNLADTSRSLEALLEANDSWALRSPIPSPIVKRSGEGAGTATGTGAGLLGPIELAGEDPFVDYNSWVEFPGTPNEKKVEVSLPQSSPVVRSTRQPQTQTQIQAHAPPLSRSQSTLSSSQSSSRSGGSSAGKKSAGLVGLGPGLMDSFLDKKPLSLTRHRADDDDDDDEDDDGLTSSPLRVGKKSRTDLLTSWLQGSDDGDCEMQEAAVPPPPRKRRRTISGLE